MILDLFMWKVNTLLYLVRLVQAPSEQELSQRQVHNVKSVTDIDSQNFVGGLGGRNITRDNIKEIFQKLKQNGEELNFIGAKL